jgi:hypothetical protein
MTLRTELNGETVLKVESFSLHGVGEENHQKFQTG